ncbi:MAG: SDR family oxidoreductase [Verrucomicrobia bacterium]|nr:SDR family oxidoreductase [Verrucomicrobiota bacterium]
MNQIDLNGKCAVITGGARGIGYAITERLMKSGARCCLWDNDIGALAEAERSLAPLGKVEVTVVDITNPVMVDGAVKGVSLVWGRLDILVNNAGIAGVNKKLWECTYDEWFKVVNLDLVAVYVCCHAVVPLMLKNNYGRIVNIASIAGKEGNPNASHYSAAKAGVIGLTKSLGKELAQTGILVNCVTPAVIQTDILKQCTQQHIDYMLSKIPMGRFGLKEEAAAMVAWLCSADCSFSTGAVFDLSGGRATY